MCQTCSPELIEVLNKNSYEKFSKERNELLDTPELEMEFLDAFNELQYANFHEAVFQGQFSSNPEAALQRQDEWEEHFENLKQTIQNEKARLEEGEDEEDKAKKLTPEELEEALLNIENPF